jgi:hypothetical protein
VPAFLAGVLALLAVWLTRPVWYDPDAREVDRELAQLRAALESPGASPHNLLAQAADLLGRIDRLPARAGEAHFLTGSAYVRMAEKLPADRADETWRKARYHLEQAEKLGVPEGDVPRLQYRLAKAWFQTGGDMHRVIEYLNATIEQAAEDRGEGYGLLTQAYLRARPRDVPAALAANQKQLQQPTADENLLAPARLLRPVALALAACGVLAAARIVPAFAAFAHADRTFMSGYPGLGALLDALSTVRRPDAPLLGSFTPEPVRWWEYDLYVGPAGLLFLGLFGLGHWLKERVHPARLLAWASLLLLAVSFGDGLYLMSLAGVPVLGQERVGARVAVAPLVCLLFLAARGCTREAGRRPGLDAALLIALVLTAGSLLTHLLVWRIAGLEAAPWDVWQLHPLPVERSAGYERLTLAAWAFTAAAWAGALAHLARGRPRTV